MVVGPVAHNQGEIGMSEPLLPPKDEFELKVRLYELERQKVELERLKFEREDRSSIWSRLPVVITVVAGASAIGFQGVGALQSWIDRDAARERADRDFDFKGLELLVTRKSDLLSCDSDVTLKNVDAFTLVLSSKVKPALQSLVDANGRSCAVQAQAASPTNTSGKAVDQTAFYSAVASQAGVLATTKALAPTGGTNQRVFLQYAAPADQQRATSLQQALQRRGFNATGVEKVAAAPSQLEVRYYKDADRSGAGRVAAIVNSTLPSAAPAKLVSLQRTYPNLPAGVIEIWLPSRGIPDEPQQPPPAQPQQQVLQQQQAGPPPQATAPSTPPFETRIIFNPGIHAPHNLRGVQLAAWNEAVRHAKRGAKQVLINSYETSSQGEAHSLESARERADDAKKAMVAAGVDAAIVWAYAHGKAETDRAAAQDREHRYITVEVRY
jgi:hypothetical protein